MAVGSQWTDSAMLTLATATGQHPQTEVSRETGRQCAAARTNKQEDHLKGANKKRSWGGKKTARVGRETPPKLGVEAALVALKTTKTQQGVMTEMGKGHVHLNSYNLQIKRIPKVTEVQPDLTKSPHPHTEMRHNLTEMTVKI